MRDLVYGQAKINELLQKKLAATDKSMETIHAKMDGFSTAFKNQLSFNKCLKPNWLNWLLLPLLLN